MKKVFLTVLLAWVVGPSVAHAQTLSNEKITALEKKIEKIDRDVDHLYARGANRPASNTFVHWGRSSAVPGTELIYSGYAYAASQAHEPNSQGTNVAQPLLLPGPDPTALWHPSPGRLWPVVLAHPLPPAFDLGRHFDTGVWQFLYLQGALVSVDAPVVHIWGSDVAPAGWELIYSGFTFGADPPGSGSTPPVSGGPICVDGTPDTSKIVPTDGVFYRASFFAGATVATENGLDPSKRAFVRCAVLKKLP